MYTFLLILVTIVWGTTFFIVKDTVSTVDEYFLVFTRNAIAAVIMIVILFFKDKKSLLDKKAIINGFVIGVLLAATYVSQTIGLKHTSSGHSAFITGSAVVIVPLILIFTIKLKLKALEIIAIAIAFAGLFFLTYDVDTAVNIGDIITIITVVAYALHIIVAERYVKNTHILSMITYQFVFASLICLVVFLFTNDAPVVLSTKATWSIVYLGLLGTLFCYFVSVWALKYVKVVKVAIIFALEPVFAAAFAYMAVGETLNFNEVLGGTLIIFGVIVFQAKDQIISILRLKKA
jgi:drug/metabolite transporter (DMT)-like permease